MVREDAGVQHVGIRQDNVSAFPDRLACITRRVAIVSEDPKTIIQLLGKSV